MRRELLLCPFCEKESLEIAKTFKTIELPRGGRSRSRRIIPASDILLSSKCINCGKNSVEIKKEYRKRGFSLR